MNNLKPLKIGIVGAGFTGTALAATLQRLTKRPVEIILCDKSGQFGAGPAYRTPYPYHLLNVRAQDMSAFEDEPTHFTNWLNSHPNKQKYLENNIPVAEQFAPRCLYFQYLQSLIKSLTPALSQNGRGGYPSVTFISDEVVDILQEQGKAVLVFKNQTQVQVDKVILALGNNPPARFPFKIGQDIRCIENPWDYQSVKQVDTNGPVLIVGTGLSMIDAVLTLHHQQHQGKIYAVSRHGLLPLPHADIKPPYPLQQDIISGSLCELTRQLRLLCDSYMDEGGDWRSVINALRSHIPTVWNKATKTDKKRFLRHVLPYWNIHRHRVHTTIMDLLSQLSEREQLNVLAGRVQDVSNGHARIKIRHSDEIKEVPVQWLINCMGPEQYMRPQQQPLLTALMQRQIISLDNLQLGLDVENGYSCRGVDGQVSAPFYALGAPTKGASWEIGAVPEIRKQIFALARHLLASD